LVTDVDADAAIAPYRYRLPRHPRRCQCLFDTASRDTPRGEDGQCLSTEFLDNARHIDSAATRIVMFVKGTDLMPGPYRGGARRQVDGGVQGQRYDACRHQSSLKWSPPTVRNTSVLSKGFHLRQRLDPGHRKTRI